MISKSPGSPIPPDLSQDDLVEETLSDWAGAPAPACSSLDIDVRPASALERHFRSDPLAHWSPVFVSSAGEISPTDARLCEYGGSGSSTSPVMCVSTHGSGRCPNFMGLPEDKATGQTVALCTGNLVRLVKPDPETTRLQ